MVNNDGAADRRRHCHGRSDRGSVELLLLRLLRRGWLLRGVLSIGPSFVWTVGFFLLGSVSRVAWFCSCPPPQTTTPQRVVDDSSSSSSFAADTPEITTAGRFVVEEEDLTASIPSTFLASLALLSSSSTAAAGSWQSARRPDKDNDPTALGWTGLVFRLAPHGTLETVASTDSCPSLHVLGGRGGHDDDNPSSLSSLHYDNNHQDAAAMCWVLVPGGESRFVATPHNDANDDNDHETMRSLGRHHLKNKVTTTTTKDNLGPPLPSSWTTTSSSSSLQHQRAILQLTSRYWDWYDTGLAQVQSLLATHPVYSGRPRRSQKPWVRVTTLLPPWVEPFPPPTADPTDDPSKHTTTTALFVVAASSTDEFRAAQRAGLTVVPWFPPHHETNPLSSFSSVLGSPPHWVSPRLHTWALIAMLVDSGCHVCYCPNCFQMYRRQPHSATAASRQGENRPSLLDKDPCTPYISAQQQHKQQQQRSKSPPNADVQIVRRHCRGHTRSTTCNEDDDDLYDDRVWIIRNNMRTKYFWDQVLTRGVVEALVWLQQQEQEQPNDYTTTGVPHHVVEEWWDRILSDILLEHASLFGLRVSTTKEEANAPS